MKVNLKKIGAVVAGAAILASSVSFAGLKFGDTTLVDDNGAPVAKVVVGENAAASDGVAAALIASKIASAAFKKSTLTAEVSGTATCTGGGSAGGSSGTCAVSDEKATLEITVPGTLASGTALVQNLIGDYLNRDLIDRDTQQKTYSFTGSDTTDPANPFKDGNASNLGVSEDTMYRVSGSAFAPLATSTLTDNSAAKSYSEQQDIWMRGYNSYSDTKDQVIGYLNWLAYTLKFKGTSDDLGIQKCTTPTNSTNYATCDTDYLTSTHKLSIKFLGEDWIISEMSPPTTSLTNENTVVTGGYVKLAKESVSGILNQGEALTVDDLKFQLDDLEAHGDVTAAIVSVLDANGNVLKKDKVTPGTTKEFVLSGKSYRFHVYKVAPGYTFGAKWADVAVYSKEIKLQHGQKLDPDYDNNKYWKVYLGWKNKGGSSTDTAPDSLRTVILQSYDTDKLSSGRASELVSGDYLPFIMDPIRWKLTYQGLSIDSSKRSSLDFTSETTAYSISASGGPHNATGLAGDRTNCTINAPFVKVRSGRSGSTFEVSSLTDGTGTASSDEFWVATGGAACSGGWGTLADGTLFMKTSSTSDYWTFKNYSGEMTVAFASIGAGYATWAAGGALVYDAFADANVSNNASSVIAATRLFNTTIGVYATQPDWIFGMSEVAGTGVSMSNVSKMLFSFYEGGGTPSSADFNIDVVQTSVYILKKDYMRYFFAGPKDTGSTTAEEGYITERGSQFNDMSKSAVRFNMANELAYAQWYLTSVATDVAPGTTVWTGVEGDSTTVSGVTVKIKSIDETAVCSGGTGGTAVACTPDMAGVSAVIVKDGAQVASADTVSPYDFGRYSPLVLLDKDAVGVSTVVSVGGDAVNTVTAGILGGSQDWNAQPQMVKEVVKGSKIVVAGKEASDTTAAANSFISQLVMN